MKDVDGKAVTHDEMQQNDAANKKAGTKTFAQPHLLAQHNSKAAFIKLLSTIS